MADPQRRNRERSREFYRRGGLAATFGAWGVFGTGILLTQYSDHPTVTGAVLAVATVFVLVEAFYNFALWIVTLPESKLREIRS